MGGRMSEDVSIKHEGAHNPQGGLRSAPGAKENAKPKAPMPRNPIRKLCMPIAINPVIFHLAVIPTSYFHTIQLPRTHLTLITYLSLIK